MGKLNVAILEGDAHLAQDMNLLKGEDGKLKVNVFWQPTVSMMKTRARRKLLTRVANHLGSTNCEYVNLFNGSIHEIHDPIIQSQLLLMVE